MTTPNERLVRHTTESDEVMQQVNEIYAEKLRNDARHRSPLQQHLDSVARSTESRLRAAVRSIYLAGHWTCDTIPEEEAKALWDELLDAAGIPHP